MRSRKRPHVALEAVGRVGFYIVPISLEEPRATFTWRRNGKRFAHISCLQALERLET